MSDETTLLSCPICGGNMCELIAKKWTNCFGDISYSAWIKCWNCNLMLETDSCGYETEEAAENAVIATWNSRAERGSEREKRLEKLVRVYGEIANYFCERFACCDAEFANCKYCIGLPQGGQCELGWCNDESKALGIEQPDYGGGKCEPVNLQELYDRISELENERSTHSTLTAEQVLEAVEKHWHDLPDEYDMPEATALPEYSYNWQAIADELNAKLGSGTCELIADLQEDKRTKTGYKLACIHCSACGEQHSGSICFREDGSYVIYRDEQDIFCRHCGSMITNDVDELSKAVKR